jgi:hypothetical protein
VILVISDGNGVGSNSVTLRFMGQETLSNEVT